MCEKFSLRTGEDANPPVTAPNIAIASQVCKIRDMTLIHAFLSRAGVGWRTGVRAGIAAALMVALLCAPGVSAQTPPVELAQWDIEVWPEYDRPAVLVLLSGALPEDTAFPAEVRIPVPADADINAVAYPNEEGRLISIPWRTEASASGLDVVFSAAQPDFVVEYYADVISPPPDRSFELVLVTPYAVPQASLALRQPARASDMQIMPAMTQDGVDSGGNPLYTLQLGALSAGQEIPLSVSYTKTDANPTISSAVVGDEAGAPVEQNALGGNWLPLAAGVLIGVAAIAALVYFVQRRRQRAGMSRQARRREARDKGGAPAHAPTAAAKPAQPLFCPQCGAQYGATDKFCRSCGQARR